MKTLTFLLEKEFKQFFRDPFMPKMVVVFPVIIMLIIPLVANLDFKNINICIVDNDHSGFSRLMTDKISHSSYFILKETPQDYKKAMEAMDKRGIDIILEIPQDFEREIVRNEKPGISIVANAVDASKGASGTAYLTQIVAETLSETMTANGVLTEKTPDLITVRNLYNPTGNYRHFMIPALTVMLIIIVCGALPALNIVKEKESGTIEQINATPVSKLTFTFGKLIPFWIMGLFILTIALVIAKSVYGLSPAGELWIVYANAMLFTLAISSFGLIISNFSETMQQAMFIIFFFIMIFVLMSGLLTPVESMPPFAQAITRFLPPRYFIETMRGVYLKGSGISDVYPQLLWLAGFTIVLTIIAIISYRKRS